MRALVIYESMYGNTHAIADAIATGLADRGAAVVLRRVCDANLDDRQGADLVVVGGPTHAWSMSRPSTRHGAVEAASRPGKHVMLEEHAEDRGLREWIDDVARDRPYRSALIATFDTRRRVKLGLAGSAARAAARRLVALGWTLAVPAESFYVTVDEQLEPGELDRARAWGAQLAAQASVPVD